MQHKVFWLLFTFLSVLADFMLPMWWALFATIPIGIACWWFAYRSDPLWRPRLQTFSGRRWRA